jgi:hypothetical protein
MSCTYEIMHDSLIKAGAGDMVLCPVCGAPLFTWDASGRWTVNTRYTCGSTFLWGHHRTVLYRLKPAVIQIRLDCLERLKLNKTKILPLITPARWKRHLKRALNHLWFN